MILKIEKKSDSNYQSFNKNLFDILLRNKNIIKDFLYKK